MPTFTPGAVDVINMTNSPGTAPHKPTSTSASSASSPPTSTRPTQPLHLTQPLNLSPPSSFGSSIAKPPKLPPKSTSKSSTSYQSSTYSSYIKPATPGAFKSTPKTNHNTGYRDGWPTWVTNGNAPNPFLATPTRAPTTSGLTSKSTVSGNNHKSALTHLYGGPSNQINSRIPGGVGSNSASSLNQKIEQDDQAETFNLDSVKLTAEDYAVTNGNVEAHMRELLAGAVGDGEETDDLDVAVDGFEESIKLMPHQVRGVAWMKSRENGSAKKFGGILADDMGLGKTVQTLARIVEGRATAAEKKAGYKGTLIIAPLAVMDQWAAECKSKTKSGLLKVGTHHGTSRAKVGKKLEDFDVVITTFQVLSSEYSNLVKSVAKEDEKDSDDSETDADDGESRGKCKSKATKVKAKVKSKGSYALFDVKWLRVVIDEAQNIKNHKTLVAKGAVDLVAKYRWCLTGTPIQNNVEELYSLFKFLRAKPLDNWETFANQISKPVKAGRTKMAMKRLHVILKAVMLRRTKDATIDGKPILNLPGRTVEVVNCPFDTEERAFYDALEKRTALTFNKYLANGSAMSNYTSVLSMLLRLRQACDHPSLVTAKLATDADAINSKAADEDDADELADLLGGLGVTKSKKCEICFMVLTDATATHCTDCIEIAQTSAEKAKDAESHPSSAKIRMLLQLIAGIEERSKRQEKTIVFSQFTSFLNLIEPFFKRNGVAYVRYDGSMRADKRLQVLNTIKTSPDVRVILMSFKAGSTGLNLTCCNNVILMDLWWNPALEDQAFDRAHRLGQKLNVNIFKLTVTETVEDRILMLQNSKRELAKAALSGQAIKNMKLTLNDMMKLFQRHNDEDED